jgi:phospholipase A2
MFARLIGARRHQFATSAVLVATPFAYHSYHNRRPLRNESPDDKTWQTAEVGYDGSQTRYGEKIGPSGAILKTGEDLEDGNNPYYGDKDETAWATFSNKFAEAGSSLTTFEWASIGDKITEVLIPDWARLVPGYVRKLQAELDMAPGSLADEIWQEAEDMYINPEIVRSARVRISPNLCEEELAFRAKRKAYTTRALAKYLHIPEKDVDPEDVPTIAMCGSGGGLRALVAGTSSYLCAQEDGLFDCVTYTAGVSGSCWLQTMFHTSLGAQNFGNVITHLKKRLGTHFAFPPVALNLLATAPTHKFLLSGLIEKVKADPKAEFGLVDIYGLLLGARLLVPRGELEIHSDDLKISNQRVNTDRGNLPLPIYTAVRHEIPIDENTSHDSQLQQGPTEAQKLKAKREAYFQWFEWTPYEFFCDEIEAGIPTWALGRQFANGVDVPRENGLGLPEMRLPQLLGIWGSAFCATLSHYYREIRPIVQGIAGFSGLDDLINERNDDMSKVHPINPASIPNFALGLEDQLPPTTPRSMFNQTHLQLMDAGMSNNLPVYPLLRPGRDVDIVIAFDASADIKQENWLSVADGYAKQRGIKGWPIGLGWPRAGETSEQTARELDEAQAAGPEEAAEKIAEAQQDQEESLKDRKKPAQAAQKELGYCTVWIGTTEQREADSSSPPSKRFDKDHSDAEWALHPENDSGIAVVYFPFVPNPKVPGVDPATSPFMSTWNSVYTPEEIDQVVALASANFDEGREQTRRCVRAIYERKKRLREERESEYVKERWRRRFKGDGDHFRG